MKQPVKISIRVDTLIESTVKCLEGAKDELGATSAPIFNGTMTSFVQALVELLCTEQQQQQVQNILALWKTCRNGSISVRSASPVVEEKHIEAGEPNVFVARQAQ